MSPQVRAGIALAWAFLMALAWAFLMGLLIGGYIW